ncbi:hypothetical protein FOLKNPGA_00401 [Legionella sp. PC1000]|nr:hypothetical protein FOLKNPGA_00401 [Legionella sp. PC1000]
MLCSGVYTSKNALKKGVEILQKALVFLVQATSHFIPQIL